MTDRTCILSGQNLPREQLIRFVAGPDGHAVADLACKLPGRGVWIENNAESLRRAAARNLLTRRIGAGFREVEEDLWDMDARLQYMDAMGIDVQVCCTVPVMFSYWARPEDTLQVARVLNDDLAASVANDRAAQP